MTDRLTVDPIGLLYARAVVDNRVMQACQPPVIPPASEMRQAGAWLRSHVVRSYGKARKDGTGHYEDVRIDWTRFARDGRRPLVVTPGPCIVTQINNTPNGHLGRFIVLAQRAGGVEYRHTLSHLHELRDLRVGANLLAREQVGKCGSSGGLEHGRLDWQIEIVLPSAAVEASAILKNFGDAARAHPGDDGIQKALGFWLVSGDPEVGEWLASCEAAGWDKMSSVEPTWELVEKMEVYRRDALDLEAPTSESETGELKQ